jgi:hypothetical protein
MTYEGAENDSISVLFSGLCLGSTSRAGQTTHHLIVVSDQIRNGRTRVLNLNPSISREREEGQRPVVVQLVSSVLPEDEGRDAPGVGGVGVVSILSLFEVPIVGAERRASH